VSDRVYDLPEQLRDLVVWPRPTAAEARLVGISGVLALFQFFLGLNAIQGTQRLLANVASRQFATVVVDVILLGIIGFGFYATHKRKQWTPSLWKAVFGVAAVFLFYGLFSYDAPVVYAGSLAVCVAWLIYWSTSRRVALTFAERRAAGEEAFSRTQASRALVPGNVVGDERKCPHCGETIKAAARICRHCRRRLDDMRVIDL
jgi:hypothetical protein